MNLLWSFFSPLAPGLLPSPVHRGGGGVRTLGGGAVYPLGSGKARPLREYIEALRDALAAAMGVTVLLGQKIGQGNARQAEVIAASAEYLKAYAIDCLLTSFLFCFIGYFSGLGRTVFVMAQGLIGAFLVRIPVSYAVSRMAGASLFAIGLATPASTLVQIILCAWYMRRTLKQEKKTA